MYDIFMQLLQNKGLTPYEISKQTGVSQATLSEWKLGKSTPRPKTLKKLADYLGVSVSYLKGEPEIEKTPDTEVSEARQQAIRLYESLNAEGKAAADKYLQFLLDTQENS